ncbi:hypothetical protein RF11_16411 [Thelohanellus kitauei]|uniref:Uncharacterized protein n=1 Tax=Thelohanellus kitauei TaxID=669202 RepID=A0A0C2MH03_THEKT|nr:hypothetical protein RF11_16411 [Thelohanellus kitauei]
MLNLENARYSFDIKSEVLDEEFYECVTKNPNRSNSLMLLQIIYPAAEVCVSLYGRLSYLAFPTPQLAVVKALWWIGPVVFERANLSNPYSSYIIGYSVHETRDLARSRLAIIAWPTSLSTIVKSDVTIKGFRGLTGARLMVAQLGRDEITATSSGGNKATSRRLYDSRSCHLGFRSLAKIGRVQTAAKLCGAKSTEAPRAERPSSSFIYELVLSWLFY